MIFQKNKHTTGFSLEAAAAGLTFGFTALDLHAAGGGGWTDSKQRTHLAKEWLLIVD
jgi:hypothetical protein